MTRACACAAAALLVLACGSDDISTPTPTPASLTMAPPPTGTPGWLLDEPLRVTVRDASGGPVPNATVTWNTAVEGSWLGAASSVTNASGVAEVPFAPGAGVGTQLVRASAGAATVEIPVPVSTFAATAVATSNSGVGITVCGIDVDEALWCWRHRLLTGNGSNQAPAAVPADARPVRAAGDRTYRAIVGVGAGEALPTNHFCAISTTDALWCWSPTGAPGAEVMTQVATPAPFVSIALATGDGFSGDAQPAICGLTADGTLWCRGANGAGQTGTGAASVAPVSAFTPVESGSQFATIAGGDRSFCATDVDGAAWCWGDNQDGALVPGAEPTLAVPTRVGGDGVYQAASPMVYGGCGVRENAELWCWGQARVRYAGHPGPIGTLPAGVDAALVVSGTNVVDLMGGGYGFAALRSASGELRLVGDFFHDPPLNAFAHEPVAHPNVDMPVGPLLARSGSVWCTNTAGLRCSYRLNAPRGVPAP